MNENIFLEDLSNCNSSYKIYQDRKKFCFGIDAILLADYAKNIKGKKICDLCTGNGIIPILLADKILAEKIDGIEIQKEIVDLANKSIKLNCLENKIKIHTCNLLDTCSVLEKNTYDAITVNPPYMKPNSNTIENSKSIARQEIYCNLEDIIKTSSKLLKSNGKFFMIHRPNRIGEIFILLSKYNLGAKRVRFIQSFINKNPTMVLIEAQKCKLPELIVEKTLTIYKDIGIYTKEVNEIYGRK